DFQGWAALALMLAMQSCPLSAGCGLRRQMTTFSGVERIAGGQLARDGEWPWQASIQLDGIHRCGASVISNTWLLTAAHCFRGFGTLLRPPTQKRFVRNIIIHEGYNDHLHNHEDDVALVELASPIKFTSDVHSVCLPEASHEFPDNASCFVTGWGALSNDGECLSLKIISTRICNMGHVYHGVITPGMLCAGYLEGQVDACQGDSGGPLVHANSRGIWYLVGIVSWGDECGKLNKPGVYTRLLPFRSGCAMGFEESLVVSLAPSPQILLCRERLTIISCPKCCVALSLPKLQGCPAVCSSMSCDLDSLASIPGLGWNHRIIMTGKDL
uniref:Peptidase S1 domain-containing protein n=1 Tax=Nothoprocta perdicaria TaxID=30464 RepID=A0A8C6YW16_NOTPE